MKAFRIVGPVLLSAVLLQAEDFSLKYFGDGPISLHTTLTFDGKGERLIATAKNESGAPIQHAKICIAAASVKKGCLFEVWNTAVWAPGAELSWNVTTAVKTADLSHEAMIEDYEGVKAPETTSASPSPAAPVSSTPLPAQPPAIIGLSSVHKVFIEKMPNDLDLYLRAEFTKQLKGKVVVVLKKEDSDGIITGVNEEQKGTAAMITGRYLGLHDTVNGTISLLDKAESNILWSDEAGDRNLFFMIAHRGGERKVADRLVSKLKKAMGY